MTIGIRIFKIIFILGIIFYIIITFIDYKKMNSQTKFKLFGDKELLDNMKINIESILEEDYPYYIKKIESLLYETKVHNIDNEEIWWYKIYFSYKDSLFGVLEFENVGQWAPDYINHLYVEKNEEGKITLFHVDQESSIEKGYGLRSQPAITKEEFFAGKNMDIVKQLNYIEYYFSTFYDPKIQFYCRVKEQ